MKRIITMTLAVLLVTALLAGCTGGAAKITEIADLEGKIVANVAIPVPEEVMKVGLESQTGVAVKEVLYYDSLQAAVAALKSGKVDAVTVQAPVADYYTARDGELTAILLDESDVSNHMVMRVEDTELLENINAALESFRQDGTLDALAQEYVTGLTPEKQLEGKKPPHFDDAETLYVGLSGDNAPIDYIAADGKPVGYNVELLALLSEVLHVNFEISVMSLESKFAALASKKIDVFFIHPVVQNAEASAALLANNPNIALSEAYFTSESGMALVLK